jgi:stress-induced morphogen
MATPMTRIKKVLEKEFSPKGIKLERTKSGRISGWVISKSFEGLSAVDRQHKIWKLLDKNLNPDDRDRIVGIFTITPVERKMAFAEWIKN